MSELWLMSVDPKASEFEVYKHLRTAVNSIAGEYGEWTTPAVRKMVDAVRQQGPQRLGSAGTSTLKKIADTLVENCPAVFVLVDPSREDIEFYMPLPDDEPIEADNRPALVAIALMGAVRGDPVQAVGLCAALGSITGLEMFKQSAMLLGEAYRIDVLSKEI